MKHLKVGIDCDDVLCHFMIPYLDRFGTPNKDTDITWNIWNILRHDSDFWINLPIKHYPDFKPELMCTARVINKNVIRKFLKKHDLDYMPVYQRFGYGLSKAPLIKGRIDVFIDDSVHNFYDLNHKGIKCLLMDSPYNRHIDTPLRVYSLMYDEIEYVYNQAFKHPSLV